MRFIFSIDNCRANMYKDKIYGGSVKSRAGRLKDENEYPTKVRQDCKLAERIILNEAQKVVRSGFVKTSLDLTAIANEFRQDESRTMNALSSYVKLVNSSTNVIGVPRFETIDDFFSWFITSKFVIDYQYATSLFSGSTARNECAMSLADATKTQRKEYFCFCWLVDSLYEHSRNGESLVQLNPLYFNGNVRAYFDLCWFLSAKILGILRDVTTPKEFFSDSEDWWKYNKYTYLPVYITQLSEKRKRLGKVTSYSEIVGLFSVCAYDHRDAPLVIKSLGMDDYVNLKLLEWATMEAQYIADYLVMFDE